MLFPLGFGFWPRTIPIAVIFIAGICVVWSVAFFPNLNALNKAVASDDQIDKHVLKQKVVDTITAACQRKFPSSTLCASAAESKEKNKNHSGSLSEALQITAYIARFQGDPQNWPEEAKATPQYKEFLKLKKNQQGRATKLALEAGLTGKAQADWFHLLRATFTHVSYFHLFGNLLMLVIFGLWVEQKEGFLFTAATFIACSFLGFMAQLSIAPDQTVLGASAGVSALMGAFIVFFWKADFNFVFMIPPVFFKRITIPLLWIFPFMYLGADIVGAVTYGSGVAHVAHLAGFVGGGSIAYLCQQLHPLPEGAFFHQELRPLAVVRDATDPEVLWRGFNQLMRWNLQNQSGLEIFLKRSKALNASLTNVKNKKVLKAALNFTIAKIMRRGSVPEVIRFFRLIPAEMPIQDFIGEAPLTQLLYLADHCAQAGDYQVALQIYKTALDQTSEGQERNVVLQSIQTIEQMQIKGA